jgi:bifunctional UDP-N-acetylglucosamine pyrophosphorylase/glucosamine-1-phosphate N-acetyltransferase
VVAIVEEKSATPEQRAIREVNSSIYCFTLAKLWPCLNALRPENAHKELYLTDAIAMLRERNERVLAEVVADAREILGCNTRAHLADIDRIFRARNAAELMESGVTIYLPETVVVDPGVTAGPDSVIEPGVQLLGNTRIGARCTIRTGSVLQNVRMDDDAVIGAHSTLDSSRVGRKAQIGPFSRLRPGTDIRAGAHVGSFVEMKKTVLGEGSKAPHLSYLGDATIGRDTNVGAGTITCNYDGVSKHPTTIGNRVFIGSDTALVAPVRIGDGAYVGAGSVITENVPADALAIARGRQANKRGWAAARRKEMQQAAKSKRKPTGRSSKSRTRAKSSRLVKRTKRR